MELHFIICNNFGMAQFYVERLRWSWKKHPGEGGGEDKFGILSDPDDFVNCAT